MGFRINLPVHLHVHVHVKVNESGQALSIVTRYTTPMRRTTPDEFGIREGV